ncbi:uncharacterized protein LTR77_009484 [Saxophila tyrrhenica]|uniref:Major facilitator superfamily (MFS) profile domain-containing protein n=1 Tax=Saxophila tyrrhenica TaxID=1690608 RepID=A0AAV9P1M0_9PEZI|nr:hypothetical protein LTR77_009484 [Saxophila tyrrhenica]
MVLSPSVYQVLVGVFASMGAFMLGYDLGVIAGVVASPTFIDEFNEPNAVHTGLVVSLFTVGCVPGAAFAGPFGDYLGRRATLALGSVVFLIGGAIQTAAMSLSYLYGGRFVAGLGTGILVMAVPLYQAELAHPNIRGRINALVQFMLGIGSFLAAWITYGTLLNIDGSNAQWRIPLGIQNAPTVFLATLIWFFPESPRWLMDKGREEDALHTLARLHANGNTSDAFVQAEFEEIRLSIQMEHEYEAKSYIELFQSKTSFKRLLIGVALQASGQMTGVSAIQYYSPTIFGQIGISTIDTLKYQGISNLLALFGEACCFLFIDKLGRRWVLIGGNLVHMVCFLIATILLAKFPPGSAENESAQWAFIAFTWIYNYTFSATVGPLSWIIPAEIFDTRTRAKGVSISTMTTFAFNTMIGQVTPIAMERIGYRYYFLFIICNFTNALFFWLFLPETTRLPLEKMNEVFAGPWIVVGSSKRVKALREVGVEDGELEKKHDGEEAEHVHARKVSL